MEMEKNEKEIIGVLSTGIASFRIRKYSPENPAGTFTKAVLWIYLNPSTKETHPVSAHFYGSNNIGREDKHDQRELDVEFKKYKIDITDAAMECYNKMYARSQDSEEWTNNHSILDADDKDIYEMVETVVKKIW